MWDRLWNAARKLGTREGGTSVNAAGVPEEETFGPGEYNIDNPNAQPGRTVALALRDFDSALSGSTTRLVPWLQDFSLGRTYTIADVRDQIQAARDAGAEGFLLWNAGGVYTRAALAGP